MMVLNAAQIAEFRAQGFLYAPGMFSGDDLAQIKGWVEELESRPDAVGDIWKYYEQDAGGTRLLNRIENFEPRHAKFAALMAEPRMLGACSQLFGSEAVLFKDKINFKKPGAGGFEAHQDMQAGWDRYGDLHISVLVVIDAQTADNGALEVMSGYHQRGLLGKMWEPLTDEDVAGGDWQPCYCQPGDVLFFDSFAPHRSGPNTTDAQRRAIYLTYGALKDGDQRAQYYADKHANYPPDIERDPDGQYGYKV